MESTAVKRAVMDATGAVTNRRSVNRTKPDVRAQKLSELQDAYAPLQAYCLQLQRDSPSSVAGVDVRIGIPLF